MHRQTSINYEVEFRSSTQTTDCTSRRRMTICTTMADTAPAEPPPHPPTRNLRWLPVTLTNILITLGLSR